MRPHWPRLGQPPWNPIPGTLRPFTPFPAPTPFSLFHAPCSLHPAYPVVCTPLPSPCPLHPVLFSPNPAPCSVHPNHCTPFYSSRPRSFESGRAEADGSLGHSCAYHPIKRGRRWCAPPLCSVSLFSCSAALGAWGRVTHRTLSSEIGPHANEVLPGGSAPTPPLPAAQGPLYPGAHNLSHVFSFNSPNFYLPLCGPLL